MTPANGNSIPPEPNAAQVNIPLPEGHTVVNYAVVLITDKGSCLLHAPVDETGSIDSVNALTVLMEGVDASVKALKRAKHEKPLIHVVPAGAMRLQ